jgi:carbonic anhydrase/acetyltransferase-like protein (isoleucine patch superfamily)
MIHPCKGKIPELDETCFIAPSADVIGDVSIGAESSVWFHATIRGDVNWIRIGRASNIQDNAVVHVTSGTAPTVIGDHVTVGHSAVVHGCTLHDRVLVGIGAIILDQAEISSDCMIGAGALVTGGTRVPAGSLVLGVPGKVVRALTEAEIASIRRRADHYVRYRELYLADRKGPLSSNIAIPED